MKLYILLLFFLFINTSLSFNFYKIPFLNKIFNNNKINNNNLKYVSRYHLDLISENIVGGSNRNNTKKIKNKIINDYRYIESSNRTYF